MLEGGEFKTLRPDERCVLWLELLCGQVRIVQGEIEAARQLLTDGFATSQQTFGTGDVLTMEFQMTLAEVYIERREIELAVSYLSPAVTTEKSGRSALCAITAQTLVAKALSIAGSLDEAEFYLKRCFHQALPFLGGDHFMIWRIRYAIYEVKLRQEDYAAAAKYLRLLRDILIDAQGPEHLKVLQTTLQLACSKLRMGEFEKAGQICQALLVQQQKRRTDTHDLITLTKAVLWLCDLQRGRTDSERGLRNDLLKSLENGSKPNPQLARRWETVALLADKSGDVDVARALRKHYDKAMELAFGIEYVQAIKQGIQEDAKNA